MRVTCQTVEEFMVCLDNLGDSSLFEDVVRASTTYKLVNEAKSEVVLHLSCVVVKDDGQQYLLECGKMCGFDYIDGSGNTEGTDRAKSWVSKIAFKGFKILPGIIGV